MEIKTQKEALKYILELMRTHHITVHDIALALKIKETNPKQKSGILMKTMAYLGGIFVLAGICAYISIFWGNMGSLTRVIITLGTGFVLYLMAVLFHQGKHLTQIITPLHIMAAILQASGLGVLLNEYFPSSQVWQHGALFVVGLMLLQQIFTFLGQRLNVLLFSSVF